MCTIKNITNPQVNPKDLFASQAVCYKFLYTMARNTYWSKYGYNLSDSFFCKYCQKYCCSDVAIYLIGAPLSIRYCSYQLTEDQTLPQLFATSWCQGVHTEILFFFGAMIFLDEECTISLAWSAGQMNGRLT